VGRESRALVIEDMCSCRGDKVLKERHDTRSWDHECGMS
jgi:hypothetical protein